MAPGTSPTLRSPSAVDIAARCASVVLPHGWRPRIDQTRLDVQSVVDAVRGQHPPPFFDRLHQPSLPIPLETIDPIEQLLPRGLAHRYVAVRRDIQSLSDGILGKHPPPFSVPHRRAVRIVPRPGPAAGRDWTPFRVTRVERHGSIAATLHLEGPKDALPSFLPGQFVTVAVELNGATHRRAYSICTPPSEAPRIAITIKRVAGGTVSGHLIDAVEAGDVLRLRGPSGSFAITTQAEAERRIILFAAGSGITPMMAIVRTVLIDEPRTRISLVLGNRSENTILFRADLDRLLELYAARFEVVHVLSRPSPTWTGMRGRVDETTTPALLDALATFDPGAATYLLCGPEGMMASVRAVLLGRGAPASRVMQERFVSPGSGEVAAKIPKVPHRATFTRDGSARAFVVLPGSTLLEAGVEAGVPMAYSCAMGGCGACKVKVKQGAVYMPEPNALSPQERAEGYALACISHPTEAIEVEPA